MKRTLQLLTLLLLFCSQLLAQESKLDFDPYGVDVYNVYRKPSGFYLLTPDSLAAGDSLGLVVFLHGFGALNPLNYGAWLREIVESGNAVIYPRYQKSIFLSRPTKFASNASKGILGGLDHIAEERLPVDVSHITYVGHSYGGTLAAYMMAKEDSLGLPKAFGGLLAAPGTSRLSGSRLTNYSEISSDVQLVIVTHDGDHTTGTEFADLVHRTATGTNKRVWIRQAEQVVDTILISQGHNECYALDETFDSGYRNYTTKRALRIGRIDAVDLNLIWPLTIELTEAAKTEAVIGVLSEELMEYEFGELPNGMPLEALPLQYGEPLPVPAEREIGGS
ncbi:MAG: alpha/beta hydrolase family protein [Saprospiraceae bacterium]